MGIVFFVKKTCMFPMFFCTFAAVFTPRIVAIATKFEMIAHNGYSKK